MRFERLADRAKRRPRRLKKQREYSEAHRQRLAAAKCPDRDEMAAAAIQVIINWLAIDREAMGLPFMQAFARELVARGFSVAAAQEKLTKMVRSRAEKMRTRQDS